MKKITIAIIAIIVLALGAIFAIAQKSGDEGHGKRGFGRGGGHVRGGFMFRGLDLTDDQKNQAKQIMEASRTKVQPLRESLKANREKLRQATEAGKFDEAQVQALATEQANISAQLLVERTRVKSQMFQILTPEQREKAAQMRAQMKDRFKDGFKSGHKGFRRGSDKAVEKTNE